jgi:hypothetical protein
MLNLTVLSPKTAQAAAIYYAQASVTLTILAIRSEEPEFNLTGEAEVFSEDTEALGNSFADAFGNAQVIAANPDELGVGDTLFLEATAQGAAGVSASSEFLTNGLLTVQNNSAEPVAVDFQADWNYSVAAQATGPDAFAQADIDLFLADLDLDTLLNVVVTATTGTGNESFAESGGVNFTLSVSAGGVGAGLLLVADASGSAAAAPLPGSLALTALGLVVLLTARRHWTSTGPGRPLP